MDLDDADEQLLGEARASARDVFDARATWPAMQARMHAPERQSAPPQRRPQRSWMVWATAAMLVASFGFGAWWLRYHSATTPSFKDFASVAGTRMTINLRDGTRVTLGPESHLRVPTDFGRGPRTVELNGEAYFAVVHDAAHPLTVYAGGVVVQDVGTAFDVNAYPDGGETRIAVSEGQVAIGVGRDPRVLRRAPVLLGAGDVVSIGDQTMRVTRGVDVAALTAWRQGRLAFDNTPLRDVIRQVGRMYGIHIELADTTLASRTLTASFGNDEKPDNVLLSIAHAVGAQVERDGKRVILTRRLTNRGVLPTPLRTADRGHAQE